VKNAIQVAATVMTDTDHCMLAGEAATKFAESRGFKRISNDALVTEWAKRAWLEDAKRKDGSAAVNELGDDIGTVGAVALDSDGHLAAATSTGGLSNKLRGRVGDTPILGAGVFADDKGMSNFWHTAMYECQTIKYALSFWCDAVAISTTGCGEYLLRTLAAKRIADNVARGKTPDEAIMEAMDYSTRTLGSDGGAVVVTADGVSGAAFNSHRMGWALASGNRLVSGCNRGQKEEEWIE
jgi:beta-aspartyl-peptidase (threonine type)